MTLSVYDSEFRDAESKLRHAVSRRGPSWTWVESFRSDVASFAKCQTTGWLVGFRTNREDELVTVIWATRRLATSTEPAQFKNFDRHTKALDWAENPVESHTNGVTEEADDLTP